MKNKIACAHVRFFTLSIFIVNESENEYFHFILLIKLNAVFSLRQLSYCTLVSEVTGMFPWGSAQAKRLKPML